MSLSSEIEQFNPYSPRAQNLTPYVLPQPEGSLASVKTIRISSSTHLESLGGEKADSASGPKDARPHFVMSFLHRLSLRFHIIHHGEVKCEPKSGMDFGNSPDTPRPIKKSEA